MWTTSILKIRYIFKYLLSCKGVEGKLLLTTSNFLSIGV